MLPIVTEDHLAEWTASFLRIALRPEEALAIHVPNEGKRSITYGAKLKRQGMRKGASDWIIMWKIPAGTAVGVIELKSAKGIVGDEQDEFMNDVCTIGGRAAVCRSPEEVYATLCRWLVPLHAILNHRGEIATPQGVSIPTGITRYKGKVPKRPSARSLKAARGMFGV